MTLCEGGNAVKSGEHHRARHTRPLLRRKRFWWPVGVLAGLIVVTVVAFTATPWPGALLIRGVFSDNAAQVKAALEPHAPPGIQRLADVHYREGDPDALLDVYFPGALDPDELLPTIIWTHGGAWISGSKDDDIPYFEILASKGYTVIAPNYSYGPEKRYPTAVFQLNDALAYVQHNAKRFHADVDRIVLAGDSAGSQLTSQLATIVTSAEYAAQVDIMPALRPEQLRGVVLTCGVYDMEALSTGVAGLIGWGFDTATWAYSGIKDYANDPAMKQMSTIDFVTADFPAAFITGGNGDALTDSQSKPFAKRLAELGVPTTELFFPADYLPALPHEYQFTLDNEAGQQALTGILDFVAERMK